jgi:hypothetical protein
MPRKAERIDQAISGKIRRPKQPQNDSMTGFQLNPADLEHLADGRWIGLTD